MTDRGLPIVDGAPACPFVAFADDRDERATSPDHRHRCYAEMRPAPRALAHQEAYCLASAFPVCPTFQDWARREAARARSGPPAAADSAPGRTTGEDRGAIAGRFPAAGAAAAGAAAGAASGAASGAAPARPSGGGPDGSAPGFLASRDRPGGGLAGSAADRLASESAAASSDDVGDERQAGFGAPLGATSAAAGPPGFLAGAPGADSPSARRDAGEWLDEEVERQDASWPDSRPQPAGSRPRREPNIHQDWERPRREPYATRRTRMQIPRLTGIWLAVAGVAVAALILFLAPGFLRGLGSGGPGSSPAAVSPSAAAGVSPSASPSPSTTPTPSLYVVQQGDTLSEIADRFGITLQALIEANAQRLPDPNNLQIGDELIIPAPGASPDASGPASGSPLP